jgi:Domain of unknown function (DUF6458)
VGIGVGLLLIAVGAILAFAVNAEIQGLDVEVVGWILMVVGLIGILLDLLLWQSWRRGFRRTAYVEGEPAPRAYRRPARRTVVEEEEVGPPPPGPPPPPP